MVAILQMDEGLKLPNDCGYNKIFKHNWVTPVYGLSMSLIPTIHKLCRKKWGWHFRPQQDIDYRSDQWYEKQNMVLSFDSQFDLIIVKLSIDIYK